MRVLMLAIWVLLLAGCGTSTQETPRRESPARSEDSEAASQGRKSRLIDKWVRDTEKMREHFEQAFKEKYGKLPAGRGYPFPVAPESMDETMRKQLKQNYLYGEGIRYIGSVDAATMTFREDGKAAFEYHKDGKKLVAMLTYTVVDENEDSITVRDRLLAVVIDGENENVPLGKTSGKESTTTFHFERNCIWTEDFCPDLLREYCKKAPSSSSDPFESLSRRAVGGEEISVAAIESLGGKWSGKPVIRVTLYGTEVTDADLTCLKALRNLARLEISGTNVTGAALEHLRELTNLEELDLHGTNVTDGGLQHLQGLPNLAALNLGDTRISDAGVGHLKALPNLAALNLGGTRVTDAGVAHLKALPNLQKLGLYATDITDLGVAHLKALTKLEWLSLSHTTVSNGGVEHVRRLTNLRNLHLAGTKVTDAGLVHLKALSKLQFLLLAETGISDAGLQHLKALTDLRSLSLLNTHVTDTGVSDLQKTLPSCRIGGHDIRAYEWPTGTDVDDSLTHGIDAGEEAAIAAIERLRGTWSGKPVTKVTLYGTEVTDADLTCLKALRDLARLAWMPTEAFRPNT